MAYGTWTACNVQNLRSGVMHFGGSLAEMPVLGKLGYIAMTAFVLNLIVAVLLTLLLRAPTRPSGATTSPTRAIHASRRSTPRSTR